VSAVLTDFQAWLSAQVDLPDETTAGVDDGPDLYSLLEQLTALRQEVNLQTKAARSQQEQNASAMAQLSRALDLLQQTPGNTNQDRDDRLRPLLKTLVELYDALAVASREAQRVQDTVLPEIQANLDRRVRELPEPPAAPSRSLLARLFGGGQSRQPDYQSAVAAWRKRELDESERQRQSFARIRQLLVSLATGYTMGLQRIERALNQHGLQPIPAIGQSFDPEKMEAVEAVLDSGEPTGIVLGEVQRGYLWNGRVFRYARVRVAK
jgi:molecular chaperone GrpE